MPVNLIIISSVINNGVLILKKTDALEEIRNMFHNVYMSH